MIITKELLEYLKKYQDSIKRSIINFVRHCEHVEFELEGDFLWDNQKTIDLGNTQLKLVIDWGRGTKHCGIDIYLLNGDTAYFITCDESWDCEYLAEMSYNERKKAAEYDIDELFDIVVGRLVLGRLEKGQKVEHWYNRKWQAVAVKDDMSVEPKLGRFND